MQDKLTEIFNLTKVTHDQECDAIRNCENIYQKQIKKIQEIAFNHDDKLIQALVEIASIVDNPEIPFPELFAREKVRRANKIALEALGKPTDYSKQQKLEFK